MAESDLPALLISQPENRRYLSGYKAEDGSLTESSGHLLITGDRALLLTDFRYQEEAAQEAAGFGIRVYKQGLDKLLAELAEELEFSRLGFEAEFLTFAVVGRLEKALKKVELSPQSDLATGLRLIKEPAEVEAMEVSLALMEEVLERLISELEEDAGEAWTEEEAAWRIVAWLKEKGAGTAFEPIVASGPNGAKPHAVPTDKKIVPGEPLVIDVGALVDGYRSDITRTIWLGPYTDKFKEVYATVRRAQLAAMEGIRPGMSTVAADALAREVIKEAGYGEYFGHSLGHGVGLATHEPPTVGPLKPTELKPGMVHTIEPGIYLPGWGGVRLEVMALITETGARVLGGLGRFYDF